MCDYLETFERKKSKLFHDKLDSGRLIEDMENKIRMTLNEIYFGKTRDIVNGLRSVQPLAEAKKTKDLQVEIPLKKILFFIMTSKRYLRLKLLDGIQLKPQRKFLNRRN